MSREMTKEEALDLVQEGKAGYYAVTVKHPIAHPDQNVLMAQDRYFLMTSEELKMTPHSGESLGMQKDGPIFFNAHVITLNVDDESEIAKLVQRDLQEHGKILGDPDPEKAPVWTPNPKE